MSERGRIDGDGHPPLGRRWLLLAGAVLTGLLAATMAASVVAQGRGPGDIAVKLGCALFYGWTAYRFVRRWRYTTALQYIHKTLDEIEAAQATTSPVLACASVSAEPATGRASRKRNRRST